MFLSENSLILAGEIIDTPAFSHETHDARFMRFSLNVERLSKVSDKITVLVREEALCEINATVGDFVEIIGELRSFNNKSGVGNRLVINAFVREIKKCEREYKNELKLCGVLCKSPVYRKTPLGREICDLMIAINRRYGRADYLPCIVWGKNAHHASTFDVGDGVCILGRIQSREYIKTIDDVSETRTTYEVSVSSIELQ